MYQDLEEMLSQHTNRHYGIRRSFRSSYGLVIVSIFLIFIAVKILSGMEEFGTISRLVALMPLLPLLELTRRYYNDYYVITRDRITHYSGRLSLKFAVPAVRCIDLRAISVSQGIIGRLLNYGDVLLATAAQDGSEVELCGIIAPQELAQIIDNLRQHSQKAAMGSDSSQAKAQLIQGD